MEVWKDVVSGDGMFSDRYEVSNYGRIRSKDVSYFSSKGGKKIVRKGKIRALSNAGGYLKVSLKKNGKERTFNVHVLVSDAFNGFRNEGQEIDHIDCCKTNNNADNLRLISKKQNRLRSISGAIPYQGVWYRKKNTNRPFCASIMMDGKRVNIGSFETPELAYKAYTEALGKNYPCALEYLDR